MRRDGQDEYAYVFESVNDIHRLNLDRIYFSTPSDFQSFIKTISDSLGKNAGKIHIADPKKISLLQGFPTPIGFGNLAEQVAPFRNKGEFRLAILNAMSNAIGDHLMGMRVYDQFERKLRELVGNVSIDFFQLSPYRLAPITKQWKSRFNEVMALPNTVDQLLMYDAYIDLGTLLKRPKFGSQPMVDFFFEAFSIDSSTVPLEHKRMKYDIPNDKIGILGDLPRPRLLLHRKASSPIRDMPEEVAKRMITEIIERTDYHVVSATPMDFSHERFTDVSEKSKTLDDFAAIISEVDVLVTVDTSAYHIADAFDIPTVVFFTSIEPDLRIRYYPYVQGIMLEKPGGMIYGLHKGSDDDNVLKQQSTYTEGLWEGLSSDEVLNKLNKMVENRKGTI